MTPGPNPDFHLPNPLDILGSVRKAILEDSKLQTAVSGAAAGVITSVFVCPLDVLKTRLQIQRRIDAKYFGVISGLQRIAKEEGFKGLYRGMTPTLIALLPNWAVYFTAYEKLKQNLGQKFPKFSSSPLLHMASACGAGIATVAVTNPLWVIKTRLQTQSMRLNMGRLSGPPYRGTFHAIRRIAAEEGLGGLYSGLLPSILGVSHVIIQFPLYEQAKMALAKHRNTSPEKLGLTDILFASAFSKCVASTITYPHEVIRSHMHIMGTGPFKGFGSTCRQIWLEEGGIRGFYKGCGTNLIRTTPAAAITFTSFELILRYLKSVAEKEGRAPKPVANV